MKRRQNLDDTNSSIIEGGKERERVCVCVCVCVR